MKSTKSFKSRCRYCNRWIRYGEDIAWTRVGRENVPSTQWYWHIECEDRYFDDIRNKRPVRANPQANYDLPEGQLDTPPADTLTVVEPENITQPIQVANSDSHVESNGNGDLSELLGSIVSGVTNVIRAEYDPRIGDLVNALDTANKVAENLQQRVHELEAKQPTVIHIPGPNGDIQTVDIGGAMHESFPFLLKLATKLKAENRNIWLCGPAGSGKTTAGRLLAEALAQITGKEVQFAYDSAVLSKYELQGFVDAQGNIISTSFKEIWTHGGVYLFDEIDFSSVQALGAFNAALANGMAKFPEGIIKRHDDCVILAAANTWGFGGDENYVGRTKLDVTTTDRFNTCPWGYDEKLERMFVQNDELMDVISETRKLLAQHEAVGIVISPRTSRDVADLMRQGMTREECVVSRFARYRGHAKWALVGNLIEAWAKN